MRTLSKSAFVYLIMILVLTGSCKQSKVHKKRQPTEAVASEQPNAVNTKTRQAEGLTQNLPTTQGELPKAEKGTTPNETTNQDGSPTAEKSSRESVATTKDGASIETAAEQSFLETDGQPKQSDHQNENGTTEKMNQVPQEKTPEKGTGSKEIIEGKKRILVELCTKFKNIEKDLSKTLQEVQSLLDQLDPYLTGKGQQKMNKLYNEVKIVYSYDLLRENLQNVNNRLNDLKKSDVNKEIRLEYFQTLKEVTSFANSYQEKAESLQNIKAEVNQAVKDATLKKQRKKNS